MLLAAFCDKLASVKAGEMQRKEKLANAKFSALGIKTSSSKEFRINFVNDCKDNG